MINFNGMAALETPEFMAERLDKFGGPESYNHYAVGWAHAMDTPFQWTKQVASHWGGTRNGTIVHWPKGIEAKGEVRQQFSHVIDIAPTVLEAAGIPEPTMVNGVTQSPYEGHVSMLYSFDAAEAPERHDLQYFEMFGNRGVYFQGWSAVTKHRTPWVLGAAKLPAFDDDIWELYDGSKDYSQAHDLSKEMPEKLHELQRLCLIEATKYNVIPLDDRAAERLNPDLPGRPQLVRGDTQVFYPGMSRPVREQRPEHQEQVVLGDGRGRRARASGADGTIIAQGGAIGGWSLYAKDGKSEVRLQPAGDQDLHDRGQRARAARQAPGARRVRLRRRRLGARAVTYRSTTMATRSARARRRDPAVSIFSADEGPRHRLRDRDGGRSPSATCRAASSPARSTGSNSRWAKTTTATWSTRRSTCG